jgi:hypothetical protein
MRVDGINIEKLLLHRYQHQGRDRRIGGALQTGTPDTIKAVAANPAAERREKYARQQNIQRIPPVRRTYLRRPAVGAATSGDKQFANRKSQWTEGLFRLSDTGNTRHNRTISGKDRT